MKAVGYIRVSTEDQAREGVSLEAQEASIRNWCQSKGYHLERVFSDAGMSGFKMKNRPGLQQALKAVSKGDAFVVFSLSRFSRSVIECLMELDSLNKRGVDFVSLSENIDTTTAMGKAFSGVLAIFNQLYRDQISEQTRVALEHKKSKGEKIGGDVPFGYEVGINPLSGEKMLVPNHEEQKILKGIQNERSRGLSLRKIARDLEKNGITTKRGGGSWHPQVVSQLLRRAT